MLSRRSLVWSCEKASSCGVSVPVVGMVAPALADDDELSTNWGRVRGAGFGDGGLEYESAWREEFADGSCNGLAFGFGLSCILEAKVVLVCGCKEVGNVDDVVS